MLCFKVNVILARKDVFSGIKVLIFALLLENIMCSHHSNFLKENFLNYEKLG